MRYSKLREIFGHFWQERGHKWLSPISLVPQDDPTTLFTGSGMQQLVPYLLGETHPLGKRLYNIQPCFRAQDIDVVGDSRHTTFFEMMGNWSLGDYFKEQQLKWYFNFLTQVLNLDKDRIFVSVFSGDKKNNLVADIESRRVWMEIGIREDHIFSYGTEKNWWSRAGVPEEMPEGEPGGPDSEVFYLFPQIKHKRVYGDFCHPNCDCGRFIEIGNSVFMEFKKVKNGFEDLPKKNVDFGGGLERLITALEDQPDIFQTQLYFPTIKKIEVLVGKNYLDEKEKMRVIADHLKASIFIIEAGVVPSNKERGYVLRRLLRRLATKWFQLKGEYLKEKELENLVKSVIEIYRDFYFQEESLKMIVEIISAELVRFEKTLALGLKMLNKIKKPSSRDIFNLYQSYGFPWELSKEILKEQGKTFDETEFKSQLIKHKEKSKKSSMMIFKGGLADKSKQTIKYHTATHLIHQALFDVLGNSVRQEGSNITGERLRFDFYSSKKPDTKDIKKVEEIVNKKIEEGLPVGFVILPKEKAYLLGAKSYFREKYPSKVKVYYIGKSLETAYSKEFCGGPHVNNTRIIGKIKIFKVKTIAQNIYRLYAC